MLNKKFIFVMAALSLNTAFAENTDKVILSLSAPESVKCESKIYNQHAFKLTVTQAVLEDGTLDTSKSKIYEDDILKGICKKPVEVIGFNDYSKVFTDLKMIKELSDDEVLKIFSSSYVGYCRYNGYALAIFKSGLNSVSRPELLKTLMEEKAIELDSSDRKEILAEVLKELVQDKQCGTFSKEVIQQARADNLKKLALADVGLDYLLSAKVSKEELLKAHFNAKKLSKAFDISLEEFKNNKYSATELKAVGFSSVEIYKAGYPLQELLANNDISELKSLASIQKFISAGANIETLKRIGFNEVTEIKPNFKIEDFKNEYAVSYDYNKAPKELKRLEYTAQEIKNAGYGISSLKAAGFDEIKDIKPLFTIEDFKNEYAVSYDYNKAPKELKRLGFSAKEIKSVGYGISALKAAGFNELTEIKPLFTIVDFKEEYAVSYDYNKCPKELKRLGYSAKEIKNVGYGISALNAAGFDEIKDIKPLYTIADFKSEYAVSYDYNKGPKELKRLGYSAKEIKGVNYGISALKAAGFDEIKEIKPLFTIADFKEEYAVSYDYSKGPKELKRLGYSKEEIKSVGYDEETLKAIGF